MIGKMQDMVTAAVVVSAADNKGSRYTSETKASSQNTQSDGNAVAKSAVQTDGVDAINAAGNPQQTGDEQQENHDYYQPLVFQRRNGRFEIAEKNKILGVFFLNRIYAHDIKQHR